MKSPTASYPVHLSSYPTGFLVIFLLLVGIRCTPADEFKSVKGTNYDEDSDTGLVTKYHVNGLPASIAKYINGKKHGVARSYYESGKLKAVVNYKYGVKQGEAKLFYKEGQLFRTSTYLDDELSGLRRKYRPNGKLLAEIPYKYGWEGVGLREYYVSGKRKNEYANLNIEKVYNDSSRKLIAYKVYFEGDVGKCDYYVGKLIENKYLHQRMTMLEQRKGKGIVMLTDFPEELVNKEITIVGKYTTKLKNPYLTQKTLSIR